MSTTIEAELMPQDNPMAVAVREAQPVGLFGTNEPEAVVAKATSVANALKAVIVRQGLVSKISGKEYPRCEAWTLLGTMLGVYPVTVWTKQVEGGWEARVEAKTRDGAIIGAAEAQCLRSERNWSNRDDFALRSMAQTRATAKCLRMPLGFVMTLAGFSATPAEEMDFEQSKTAPRTSQNAPQSTFKPRPIPTDPPPAATPPKPKCGGPKALAWMIEKLQARPGEPGHNLVTDYFRAVGYLMPNEELTDLPFRFVPMTADELKELRSKLAIFERGERAEPAFEPHEEPTPIKGTVAKVLQQAKPVEVPDAAWRVFPMPWGKHAGVAMEKLEKNYLFGLWANYEVEREYKGKPKKPETIAKDETFRAMLDLAGKHYEFRKEGEEEPEPVPKDADVEEGEPF